MFQKNWIISSVKSYSRYHPSAGYWWQFKNDSSQSIKKKITKNNDPVGSYFQRQKVDALLTEHAKKFPIKSRSQNDNIQNDAGQNEKKNQGIFRKSFINK